MSARGGMGWLKVVALYMTWRRVNEVVFGIPECEEVRSSVLWCRDRKVRNACNNAQYRAIRWKVHWLLVDRYSKDVLSGWTSHPVPAYHILYVTISWWKKINEKIQWKFQWKFHNFLHHAWNSSNRLKRKLNYTILAPYIINDSLQILKQTSSPPAWL